jgi:hypothetical protein
MHVVVSNAMAVWLFTLAVSGWCCHSATVPDSPTPRAVAGCCEHCEPEEPSEHQPAPSRDSDTKCHGVCVYLPGTKAQVDTDDTAVPFDVAMLASTVGASHVTLAHSWAPMRNPSKSALPVRLHLLHQLLLI